MIECASGEGAHHADERAQAPADEDEAEQEDAGDRQPVRMCSTPSFSIDQAMPPALDVAPRAARASRWRGPDRGPSPRGLPARKRRAMWRCPGARPSSIGMRQREATGTPRRRCSAPGRPRRRPPPTPRPGRAIPRRPCRRPARSRPRRPRATTASRPAASSSASIEPSWFVSIAGSRRASSRSAIPRSP